MDCLILRPTLVVRVARLDSRNHRRILQAIDHFGRAPSTPMRTLGRHHDSSNRLHSTDTF
jgi:hypothetical protein